jgi:hypothetical protein
MTNTSDSPTPRREFLGQIAASAIVLAGTACAPASAVQSASAAPAPAPAPTAGRRSTNDRITPRTSWDDSWFARLTAKHKAVFDSPQILEGTILGPGHATRYINGMQAALGASGADVQTVVVIRHSAIPFAFNDAMWSKYEIGKGLKIKGDGGQWATRNPIAGPRQGGSGNRSSSNADRPQANAVWLSSHGHVLLGCDLATQGFAAGLAEQTGGSTRTIYDELSSNLVSGLILQPNGIYATLRAQEAGCAFMRST